MLRDVWTSTPRMIRSAAIGGLAMLLAAASASAATTPQSWPTAGADISNTRARLSPVGPNQLNARTAKQLQLKWTFVTSGDVSATPSVEPGGLYVPDWGGMLYKLDPDTGAVIWSHKVSDYTNDPNSRSRSTPAIVGNNIYIGDLSEARVICINKTTGQLIWVTRVENNTDALTSTSPTVYNNIVYFGVSSREESPEHPPTGGFRGSVVALNATTGKLLWKFVTVPLGYTGGGVVSPPVVDAARGALYIAADNNYSIPDNVETCVKAAGTNEANQLACMDPSNYVDAVLSLNLNTGAINWSRRFSGADTWTEVCTDTYCTQPPGNDFDFASAPNLFQPPGFTGVSDDRGGKSDGWLLGIGQKNGIYRGLNPDNGGIFWSTLAGQGGIQWGSAVDLDTRQSIYVAVKNQAHRVNTLTDYYGNKTQWNAGSWGRINALTGQLIWQIPAYGTDFEMPQFGASAAAAVSFSNNVMYAGDSAGWMTALDSTTGAILWKFQSGGSVWSGPAIFNDCVYWGTGYGRLGGKGFNRLYAFSFQ